MLIIVINAQSHSVDAPTPTHPPLVGGGDHLCPYGRKLIGSLVPLFSFNPFLDVWKWDETLALGFNMLRPNKEVSKRSKRSSAMKTKREI